MPYRSVVQGLIGKNRALNIGKQGMKWKEQSVKRREQALLLTF
ncbi:hypothetical protein [Porphyromonas sp. COT-108 OH2963]|nr:hypothetical protein [Porphyromonas sp. COT-108 OH2963]